MWSPVRKALGVNQPGYLGEWHAFRQYVGDVTGPAADRLYVWFEADLLPGYAWSFPLPGNRANIGFGVFREESRRTGDMKDLWADLLRRPHITAALGPGFVLEDRHTAWPIPARVDDVTLSHGRTLFVGDAAAATDVMTGEGIGQALLSGRLAAEAILAAGTDDPATARGGVRVGDPPPPVRRPRDVAGARQGAAPTVGCAGRDPRRRHERAVGASQLRALDVRGRTARSRSHTSSLAPPVPRPAGRLPRLTGAGQRERRAFGAGSGSLRSSAGELTSMPSTVRSTPSLSTLCGSPDASTSIGISSLVGPS